MPMSFIVNQMSRLEKDTVNTKSEERINIAMQMYKQGKTWVEITGQTGLTAASIRYHLNRRGIPLRTK